MVSFARKVDWSSIMNKPSKDWAEMIKESSELYKQERFKDSTAG